MMDEDEKYTCFGQELLKRDFGSWFRIMFKLIEDKDFVVNPIHPELFETFEKIYQHKLKRVNLNLPPRSAKTTLSKYFLVYGITSIILHKSL